MPDLHDFGSSMSNAILQAAFDGRLKTNVDELSNKATASESDLAILTAGAGKDLYLIDTHTIYYHYVSGTGSTTASFRLYINGTAVERSFTTSYSTSTISSFSFPTDIGKVSSGEVIKMTVEHNNTNLGMTYRSKLTAIEVPTGENPLEYKGE